MIGSLNPSQKEVTIVGAGISGLIIGYRLKQLGYQVQILEQSGRTGGLIETIQTPYGLVEAAAHSLMVNASVKKFFDTLKVPLLEVNKDAHARYIVRNGKLSRFPLTPFEAFSALKRFFSAPPVLPPGASLQTWCEDYLSKPVHDYLMAPFVSGVFACAPSELNARLAFPQLVPAEKTSLYQHFKALKKSRSGARPQMMTPLYGMKSVVDALTLALKDEIKLNAVVNELPIAPNVILSVPTSEAARLLLPVDSASAQRLAEVRYSPLVTVTAFFKDSAFPKGAPRGVGVLIPRSENIRTLGVLFNSSAFHSRVAHDEITSLTFMFGGTQDPSALDMSDEEIKAQVSLATKKLWNGNEPDYLKITRWKRAIPIYSNALMDAHESLKKGWCAQPGMVIFSNYSGQVSIRGMIETLENNALH